jgi:hypothetical protein
VLSAAICDNDSPPLNRRSLPYQGWPAAIAAIATLRHLRHLDLNDGLLCEHTPALGAALQV